MYECTCFLGNFFILFTFLYLLRPTSESSSTYPTNTGTYVGTYLYTDTGTHQLISTSR